MVYCSLVSTAAAVTADCMIAVQLKCYSDVRACPSVIHSGFTWQNYSFLRLIISQNRQAAFKRMHNLSSTTHVVNLSIKYRGFWRRYILRVTIFDYCCCCCCCNLLPWLEATENADVHSQHDAAFYGQHQWKNERCRRLVSTLSSVISTLLSASLLLSLSFRVTEIFTSAGTIGIRHIRSLTIAPCR